MPKKGKGEAWTVCWFKGDLARKRGWCFWVGGSYPNAHYDMVCDGCNCYFSFWAIFGSLTCLKNKNFKKMEKKPSGDIIILHKCTKNHDQMLYCSWDMECNRQNFLSFWTAFCPFTSYKPRKSKFWKNEKSTWRYYHFINVYHKWQSYDKWFQKYGVQWTESFVILNHFLPFYPLLPNW